MPENLTPMMQQYMETKAKYKDCILFFRLGDFYEMFFDDAELASRELEITLTGRDCGMDARAPMCGVPYHAAETYISKLIAKGYKVAICEQVEDPALATGLVKRDVIRVITPGTVTDSTMLDDKRNNYIMAAYRTGMYFGLAIADVSTGEFNSTSIIMGSDTPTRLLHEIARYAPSEIVANSEVCDDERLINEITVRFNPYLTRMDDKFFASEAARAKISAFFPNAELPDPEAFDISINASGALLEYLDQTQKVKLTHFGNIANYKAEEYMVLDLAARRNLELTETMRDKTRKGSLLWVLDRTVTSMGARTLRKWLEQPLIDLASINARHDGVAEFKDKFIVRQELREIMGRIYDIERLAGKTVLGSANARDLVSLKASFSRLPALKSLLGKCSSPIAAAIDEAADDLDDLRELIDSAINDEPPVQLKEGGLIKPGYNEEADGYRTASKDGKAWVAALETDERERTGIKNLKVGFNRVFGFYIEVTRSYQNLVPETYIRKQTLANCERYITEDLKTIEEKILGAEEKLVDLEYRLFIEVRDRIAAEIARIKRTAGAVAVLDALCSFAEVADREDFVRPQMHDGEELIIKDGRHPVVEKARGRENYVPNDTFLDLKEDKLSVITGPNMAGKSTYIRQVALITLMAQAGSFVPASEAEIGLADRIFTRIGASDDLASGQSTFMVEMAEVAAILKQASRKSLLVLDEVGRGTSTYDGLSIAWAVIEYIADPVKLGCRTLFATHYHELTELEGKLPGIKNYCISVREKGDDIIFLRKIIRGGADDSYGIQVAKLAGIPAAVVERAKEILAVLEESDITRKENGSRRVKRQIEGQMDIFTLNKFTQSYDEVINELKNAEIGNLTPLDALNLLYRLQKMLGKV